MARYTRTDFVSVYPDEGSCLMAVWKAQYGGRALFCPACSTKSKFHPMSKRRGFACQECGHHIFPCAGTVFDRSSTPLMKWFLAIYLLTETRAQMTVAALQAELGVTYKTAWRMRDELRKLMATADYRGALGAAELNDDDDTAAPDAPFRALLGLAARR
jgi:hypothetical protein